MKVKVEVKAKHIKAGLPENFRFCPIALAVKDKGFQRPYVTVEVSAYDKEDNPVVASLPLKALNFIDKFDEGKKVKPFSFVANFE